MRKSNSRFIDLQSSLLKDVLLFVSPFVLWVCSFKSFYAGSLLLYGDATRNYIYTNYYLNTLMRGVYPMWNPFDVWGKPDDFPPRLIGDFNPFIYLIALYQKLGLPYSLAYFIYLVSYWFIGCIGFYLLAKRVFSDKRMAYAAFLMLMFSSVGTNIFNDVLPVLIMVAAIWFFYFLVGFVQTQGKKFFAGMTFCLMILVTMFLPFYFITLLSICALLFLILYPRDVKRVGLLFLEFNRKHKVFVLFCVISLLLALVPGVLWYSDGKSGEYLVSWRQTQEGNAVALTSEMINASGIIGPFSMESLFSGLAYNNVGAYYLPVWCVVVFLLGLIVKIDKRSVFLWGAAAILILISLGDVTPIYPFFYEHVFFFKLYRNLHFLFLLSIPIIVLLVVGQLRDFLKLNPPSPGQQKNLIIYIFAVHVSFGVFLSLLHNPLKSSYAILVLSCIFFLSYFLGHFQKKERIVWAFLLVLISAQSLEVFSYMTRNASHWFEYSQKPYSSKESSPKFKFVRPTEEEKATDRRLQGFGDIDDTSGFVLADENKYVGVKWPYLLLSNIKEDVLKDYVRYKFVAYDQVKPFEDGDLKALEKFFAEKPNVALVPSEGAKREAALTKASSRHNPPDFISQEGPELKVTDFDLNRIEFQTHFDKEKFLVYNDSYQSDWKAFVNGKPAKIYRANYAFKGLWLPQGANTVQLFYRREREFFNLFLIVYFWYFMFYLIWSFKKAKI